MAEETDKKRPKATLIKHRSESSKPEAQADNAAKSERKKVVVVKKKVVVKKSPVKVSSSKKEDEPVKKTEAKNEVRTAEKETPKKSMPEKKPDAKPKEEAKKPPEASVSEKDKTTKETVKKAAPKDSVPEKTPEKAEKSAAPAAESTSSERISSGKDTVASPPKRGSREVQVLETKRTGGRAGVVAGRRVDGGFNRSSGGRAGVVGGRRPSGGPPGRDGGRSGGFRPSGDRPAGGRPPGPGRPGARPTGGRPMGRPGGRPGGPGAPGGPRTGRPGSPSGRPSTQSRSGGFGSSSSSGAPPAANRSKKFYKAKKIYEKHKEEQEKLYQYSKKKHVIQANPVPKEIDIMEVITVSELARKMNLKASDLISKLMSMGMMVTINQQIDAETATILADDFDCKVNIVSLYDETIIESEKDSEENLRVRPPIVTVMGHVDHGKTKLLDAIRNADVVAGEHGGITQHIGAYMVHTKKGNITFLDTPGHSAFTMMRARGAQITDLVVLVVAADDGVMPQTIEAIQHAKEAGSPIIVAVNKMDLPDANPDRVKQQLSEYNLMPEDWGGSTQFVHISALKGEGIDDLLDVLILESEMLELKANWDRRAEGKVIESKVDQGRGIVSTVLVERGTLRIGDAFVAGIYHGKVRAMFDDKGQPVKEATPSMPVEILGFSGVPEAGNPFQVTENEREARQYGSKRQELKKMETARNVKKVTLDNLYDSIQDGDVQELKVIIKGDVHGSVEALQATLEKLSTSEIRLVCIRSAAGAIIEDDVNLAAASDAIIIGFHVRPTPKAQTIAEREKVEIRKYNVIYDAVEDIKAAMEGMLAPDYEEVAVGQVEVRETFKVPKIGTIAGCMVTSGYITRKSQVHLIRDNVIIHTGGLASLKRFKDDAKEVKEGFECGVGLEKYTDIQVGDVFEVFEMKEIAKKLGDGKADE